MHDGDDSYRLLSRTILNCDALVLVYIFHRRLRHLGEVTARTDGER